MSGALRRHPHVQDDPGLIHGTPQVVRLAIDPHEHFIEVPFITRPRPTPAQVIGNRLANLLAPLPDRFVGPTDVADQPQLFNSTVTEAEAAIQPHTGTDAFAWEAMTMGQRRARVHDGFYPPQLSSRVNAP